MGDFIVCFHFLSWSTSHSFPQKVFLFNYLNFPPQAVCLSATLASASCSAEHPSIPSQQLKLGRGLELLSEGVDSTSFLSLSQFWLELNSLLGQKRETQKERNSKQTSQVVSRYFAQSHDAFWMHQYLYVNLELVVLFHLFPMQSATNQREMKSSLFSKSNVDMKILADKTFHRLDPLWHPPLAARCFSMELIEMLSGFSPFSREKRRSLFICIVEALNDDLEIAWLSWHFSFSRPQKDFRNHYVREIWHQNSAPQKM